MNKILLAFVCCCLSLAAWATGISEADVFSPEGYEFLQYIQSDGTAYIDTGVTMGTGDRVELVFQILEKPSKATGIFGSRAGAGSRNIAVGCDASMVFVDYNNEGYNTYRLSKYTDYSTTFYYVENSQERRWISTCGTDGGKTNATAWTGSDFTCPGTAWIFAIQNTDWLKAKAKLGTCRIFQAGTLTHNYVPARRQSDQAVGLYDTVVSNFLVNAASSGTLTAGPASRYRRVEWIAAEGSQWIDTGFKMKGGDKFSVTFMPTATDGNMGIFGARTAAFTNNISALYTSNQIMCDYNNNGSTVDGSRVSIYGVPTCSNLITTAACRDYRKIAILDGSSNQNTTEVKDEISCPTNAAIFQVTGSGFNRARARLYDCRIWRDAALARNFQPVVRTWDGIGVLFDSVQGREYDSVEIGPRLTAAEKDWITVTSDQLVGGEYLPSGLGRLVGLSVGEELTLSCPSAVTNLSGRLVGECTGWRLDRADGSSTNGTETQVTLTITEADLYGKLTWLHRSLASCAHRSELTIAADAVAFEETESAPEQMPVLVRLSESRISGFRYADCKARGLDIFFATDGVGANVLAHEIDTWNTDGESLVWVKMPKVEAGEKIYLFWGGSRARVDPTDVWSAYAAVWHFNADLADATGRGHTAVRKSGAATSEGCVLGLAQKNGNLSAPSVFDALSSPSNVTVSGWFNVTEVKTRRLISTKTAATDDGLDLIHTNYKSLVLRGSGAGKDVSAAQTETLYDGNWKHYAGVFNDANAELYANGVLIGTGTIDPVLASAGAIGLGGFGGASPASAGTVQAGMLDECRVYNGVASATWIRAEHATVANENFFTYGAAVDCGMGKNGFWVIVK